VEVENYTVQVHVKEIRAFSIIFLTWLRGSFICIYPVNI